MRAGDYAKSWQCTRTYFQLLLLSPNGTANRPVSGEAAERKSIGRGEPPFGLRMHRTMKQSILPERGCPQPQQFRKLWRAAAQDGYPTPEELAGKQNAEWRPVG